MRPEDDFSVDLFGVVHIVRLHETKYEYGHFHCGGIFDEAFYEAVTPAMVRRADRTLLPPTRLECIVAR